MSNINLHRLSYGAANLGNLYTAITDEKAFEILETAWQLGIRYFDTAPHYGLGLSERRLGAFLATKPRGEFVVSTKVGRLLRPNPNTDGKLDDEHDFAVPATLTRVWDFSLDGIRQSLNESLERLGLDAVDIAYLHDPELNDIDESPMETGLTALAALRAEGTVSTIGVGSMSTDALLASERTGIPDVLMVAGRYTLADQDASTALLPECISRNIGVICAAVFNSGLLVADLADEGSLRFDYRRVSANVLARVRRVAVICSDFDVELATAALQFPLCHDSVRTIVAGASSPTQLRQNAARMATTIPDELWSALAAEGLIA